MPTNISWHLPPSNSPMQYFFDVKTCFASVKTLGANDDGNFVFRSQETSNQRYQRLDHFCTTISYATRKCTNMKLRQKVVQLFKFNWRLEQWTLEQHQMLLAQYKEPEQVDCDRSFRL